MSSKPRSLVSVVVPVILATVAACSGPARVTPPIVPVATGTPATPASIWLDLLQSTPYPYTTPLPPAHSTVLDGSYIRFDLEQDLRTPEQDAAPTPPGGGVWMWHPVRPTVWVMPPGPYSVEGGAWILQLDKGVFRVLHEATGWHSLGSYAVSGNRIELFNDPHCIEAVGIYTWSLESGRLALEAIKDECGDKAAFLSGSGQRASSFARRPWMSCQPPSTEAAVSGHWPVPAGCGGGPLNADN